MPVTASRNAGKLAKEVYCKLPSGCNVLCILFYCMGPICVMSCRMFRYTVHSVCLTRYQAPPYNRGGQLHHVEKVGRGAVGGYVEYFIAICRRWHINSHTYGLGHYFVWLGVDLRVPEMTWLCKTLYISTPHTVHCLDAFIQSFNNLWSRLPFVENRIGV